MPAWLIPAIGAAANLLGQGVSALSQNKVNRDSQKFSEMMYGRQRADALADWNMQNDYNSPQKQMERFRSAGLNPNLIYGQMNEGATVRSSSPPQWSPRANNWSGDFVGSALAQFLDARLKGAQTDNVKAATDVAKQDALLRTVQIANTTAQTSKTEQDTATGRFNLDMANNLKAVTLESAEQNLRNLMSSGEKIQADTKFTLDSNERAAAANAQSLQKGAEEILNLRLSRAKTDDERALLKAQLQSVRADTGIKQQDLELRKKGIFPGDPGWWRALMRVLDMGGKIQESPTWKGADGKERKNNFRNQGLF